MTTIGDLNDYLFNESVMFLVRLFLFILSIFFAGYDLPADETQF